MLKNDENFLFQWKFFNYFKFVLPSIIFSRIKIFYNEFFYEYIV